MAHILHESKLYGSSMNDFLKILSYTLYIKMFFFLDLASILDSCVAPMGPDMLIARLAHRVLCLCSRHVRLNCYSCFVFYKLSIFTVNHTQINNWLKEKPVVFRA